MLCGILVPWKESEVKVWVAHLCPTLCNSMECSPPGSSVQGLLQARILEWVAIFFSRGSSQPRDWTQVSRIAGGFFTVWATREDLVPWPGTKPVSPAVEVWKVLTTGPPEKFLFKFSRNHLTVFQSGCTNLHFYHQCVRVLFSPHPHQHLLSVPFFDNNHSHIVFHCGFALHFPND